MIYKLFLFFLLMFPVSMLFAQDKGTKIVWMEKAPEIDGDLREWGDSLQYHFPEQGMRYALANDDQYLYVTIQVRNEPEQLKAIYSGFSIMINDEGKERPGPTVIFPIPDLAALRATNAKEDYEKSKDMRQAGLNMVRAIYVDGFERIVGGPISLNNRYGIKTAVQIDSTNYLNYEAAISLDQLNLDKNKSFALNLRINETISRMITEPGYNRNRAYGSQYGRNRYGVGNYGTRSRMVSKAAEGVWHLVELATNNE